MAKRVLVILSGCGAGDGSDVQEAILTMLAVERSGGRALCAAPDLPQPTVFDHRTGQPDPGAPPRQALVEAARLCRGQIRELASVGTEDFDALVVPGGAGVGTVLSNYAQKAQLCDIHPDVVRLLKAALSTHRPMGFIGLGAILAARVLGPVAGVRVTLGPRAAPATKHAAVMGADVRPSAPNDIFIDQKNRVITTAGFLQEDLRLLQAAQAVEKLVRTVIHLGRDRSPALAAPPPAPAPAAARKQPAPSPPAAAQPQVFRRRPTRDRGSA